MVIPGPSTFVSFLALQDALTTTACGILTVLKGQHLRPVQGGFPSIAFPSVGASVSATNPLSNLAGA